jgi:hypothetical protein
MKHIPKIKIKPMEETFKEMFEEYKKLAEIIEKLKPNELQGFKTTYKKQIIDGDLFYTGSDLLRPITPSEVAILLSEEQKKKLLEGSQTTKGIKQSTPKRFKGKGWFGERLRHSKARRKGYIRHRR